LAECLTFIEIVSVIKSLYDLKSYRWVSMQLWILNTYDCR